MSFIRSTQDTALIFDVDVKTIRNWGNEGCPKEARGKWDTRKVFIWYRDNKAFEGSDTENEEVKKFRAEDWKYRSKKRKVEFELLSKRLIYIEDVAKEWASRAAEFKSGLEYLAMILPALLEGKDQAEMRVIIEDEVWKLFDRVIRTGRFCPEKAVEKLKRKK